VEREKARNLRWGAVDEGTQRALVICGRIFLRLEDRRRRRVDGFLIQFVIAEFHTGNVNGDIQRAGLRGRIKNDGAAGPLKETPPDRNTAQVISLELWMSVTGVNGVCDRGGRGRAVSRSVAARTARRRRTLFSGKYVKQRAEHLIRRLKYVGACLGEQAGLA